jgi:hypothetical protein
MEYLNLETLQRLLGRLYRGLMIQKLFKQIVNTKVGFIWPKVKTNSAKLNTRDRLTGSITRNI